MVIPDGNLVIPNSTGLLLFKSTVRKSNFCLVLRWQWQILKRYGFFSSRLRTFKESLSQLLITLKRSSIVANIFEEAFRVFFARKNKNLQILLML